MVQLSWNWAAVGGCVNYSLALVLTLLYFVSAIAGDNPIKSFRDASFWFSGIGTAMFLMAAMIEGQRS